MKKITQLMALIFTSAVVATSVQASTDYGPAIYNEAYPGHWYTTGNGHKFHVIHDMEGYYLSTISYFKRSTTSASIHYCVNGLKDSSTDAPEGEITQMVRDAYYGWHALCWNTHSTGTEHEGFVSNPAWYTVAMYQASAGITKNLAAKYGWAKDRNHIIGHDQKRITGWPAYASANLGIDPNCNSHTDPGLNWDWTYYMSLINPTTTTIIVDNTSAGFSTIGAWATGSSATDKYGADYRYRSTAAVSEPATWTANLPSSGNWTVSVWYPAGSNRSTAAPFIISTAAGDVTQTVNQQITGGTWVNQGTYNMNAGTATVDLSCWAPAGYVVVADAVKWVK